MRSALASDVPRTTIDIDASVLRELKKRKRRENKTLGQLASELLARALADNGDKEPPPFEWITKDMQPLVDLDDKEAVLAILDAEDLPPELRPKE